MRRNGFSPRQRRERRIAKKIPLPAIEPCCGGKTRAWNSEAKKNVEGSSKGMEGQTRRNIRPTDTKKKKKKAKNKEKKQSQCPTFPLQARQEWRSCAKSGPPRRKKTSLWRETFREPPMIQAKEILPLTLALCTIQGPTVHAIVNASLT